MAQKIYFLFLILVSLSFISLYIHGGKKDFGISIKQNTNKHDRNGPKKDGNGEMWGIIKNDSTFIDSLW